MEVSGKEDSLGSDTPRTVTDSHATSSDMNKEDDHVSSRSEEGQSPRWESAEEEDPTFFPSARHDRSDTPEPENKAEDDDDGPAKSVKHRKRVLTAQSNEPRRRKLDPEALARHKQMVEKRSRVQGIVQQAMFDSSGHERDYSLQPVQVRDQTYNLEFAPGSKLCNEVLEDLLSLTRENMMAMYDATGNAHWSWSDTRKRGELRNERMRFILMKEDESVLGFVAFRFTPESMIPHVYVHEVQIVDSLQGRGLGQALMYALEGVAREASMQLLMLTVFTRNASAMRFYERLGFHVDEASPGPCYNLLEGDLDKRSPYEIMSKVLDEKVLEHGCSECDYRCRFEDTLIQHAGLAHGHPFPFNCAVEGCLKGTVHLHQLHRHNEIKHGIKPPTLGVTTRRASAAAAAAVTGTSQPAKDGVVEENDDDGDQQNYLHARVMLKTEGRKGTVLRMDKGFYTVRLDGPTLETVVCRATNFEGHKYIPPKKKVIDPDHEFALKLQYEDGWARKSSRVRGKPLSS